MSEKIDEAEAQRLLDVNLGYEPLNPVTTSITPPSPKRPRPILWLVSKPRRSPRRSDLIVEAPVVSLCDTPGLRDS